MHAKSSFNFDNYQGEATYCLKGNGLNVSLAELFAKLKIRHFEPLCAQGTMAHGHKFAKLKLVNHQN